MRRKIVIEKREIRPDPRYSSTLVRKLINKLMWSGELRKSQNLVYKAASLVEKEIKLPFDKILAEALENAKPGIELRTRKVGGGKRRVIVKINTTRNAIVAMQIIKNSVRKSTSIKPAFQILAEEIKNAYNKTGNAIKKKESILKEAESSRVSAY